MEQELRKIKKLYGEAMTRFCRDNFSTILEKEGQLLELLTSKFEPNHDLYNDILEEELERDFKDYIYSFINVKQEEIQVEKTPQELLSDAGYDLYECKTEKQIQSFKNYYVPKEELCTFNGGRLDSCRVFFAVKKNVNDIKREDFVNPKRQDEYGTSVISIQFTKDDSNTLSIKNRYNHTVKNPDATFSNNLDNIIPGLTKSFEKYYGIIQEQNENEDFEITNYVKANDGKFYKYNSEINNTYYCPNNIIIDNFEVKKYEKEKFIVLDYFILDLVNKEIKVYDVRQSECFCQSLRRIKNIEIKKLENGKSILLTLENDSFAIIDIDFNNQIIGYKNNFITQIGDYFLCMNETLKELELLNVRKIGNHFMRRNNDNISLAIPNLEEVGNCFLESNEKIENIEFLKLEKVGDSFFYGHRFKKNINLPLLKEVGSDFLCADIYLEKLTLPSLISCKRGFMRCNKKIKTIDLPKLEEVGSLFLAHNIKLTEVNLPSLRKTGNAFLEKNNGLIELELPELMEVGSNFCMENKILNKLNCPNLKIIGEYFLYNNIDLLKMDLPSAISIGNYFLFFNPNIESINLPEVTYIGKSFLHYNNNLRELYLPKVKQIAERFMVFNTTLKKIDAPMLETVDSCFLYRNS